ncbi:MAG: hypothetical protein NTY76_05730 [Candidatus Omnitrophica bacterium]|nr:hypothetical protein [Candidatus Omnitrophota bacterium]
MHQTVTAMNKDKVVLSVKDINTEYLDVIRGLAGLTNVVTYDKVATDLTRVVTEHQVVTVASKVDYDDWGNATLQTVKAYANATLDTLLSIKTIRTTYAGANALKAQASTTDVVTTSADGVTFEEHQFVETSSYDNWGNALHQTVTAMNKDKVVLSVKDINTEYLDVLRGLAKTTDVITYADSTKTIFAEHQVVEASNYDDWGNAKNQIVRGYSDGTKSDDKLFSIKNIEITYLNSLKGLAGTTDVTTTAVGAVGVERQVVTVASEQDYDAWGNALVQTVEAYFGGTRDQNMLLSVKHISTTYIDAVRGLAGVTDVITNRDLTSTASVEHQVVTVASKEGYDDWGNALVQTVEAYSDNTRNETALLSAKNITNTYNPIVSALRGFADTTDVVTKTAKDGAFAEHQFVTTSGYDLWGNATNQTVKAYSDASKDQGKLLSVKYINTEYLDVLRGIAKITDVTTYADIAKTIFAEHQIVTVAGIEGYDMWGNATSQIVTAKNESGDTLSVKEIKTTYLDTLRGLVATTDVTTYDKADLLTRTFAEHQIVTVVDKDGNVTSTGEDGYDSWGNALYQIVTTKNGSGDVLSFKTVNNTYTDNVLRLRGLVTTTDVTTYADIAKTIFAEHQFVTTASYDDWGNAKNQTVKAYSDITLNTLLSIKNIETVYFDENVALSSKANAIRGLASTTDVTTWDKDHVFAEHQFVTTTSYDGWGNALTQTVEAYSSADIPRDPLKLLSVKVIENKYVRSATPSDLEKVNAIRGLTITIDVTTYADIAKTIFAEHQFVETSTYDDWGNATLQTVKAYSAADKTDPATKLLSIKTIETSYVDTIRGLSGTTKVTTKAADGSFEEYQVVIVASAADYDDWGNALRQTAKAYSDATMNTLLSIKNITNTYTKNPLRGLADTTDVITMAADGVTFAEHQFVETSKYDDWGNALNQTVKAYANSDITRPVDKLLSVKGITNTYSGVNAVLGRADTTEVITYADIEKKIFAERQLVITSDYDDWGNATAQTIKAKDEQGAVLSIKAITTQYIDPLRGLAGVTDITTYNADYNFEEHQVSTVTNVSDYDAWGNAMAQTVRAYSDATLNTLLSIKNVTNTYTKNPLRGLADTTDVITKAANGDFAEHQFVTTTSYDDWGNALIQTVEAYSSADIPRDPLKLLSVKAIENKYVLSATPSDLEKVNTIRGLAGTTDVITYADAAKTIFAEHQFVTTSSYDALGNATAQTVAAYSDRTTNLTKLLNTKNIITTYLDQVKGTVGNTNAATYDKNANFVEHQIVEVADYDAFNNAVTQTVTAMDESETVLSVKTITNKYSEDNALALRGLAIATDVTTYADAAKTIFAEHQFVETSTYDDWGNATLQTVRAYSGADKAAQATKLLSIKTIETSYIDTIRGLSGTTKVTTKAADGITFEEYQVVTAMDKDGHAATKASDAYDVWGNALYQSVNAYSDTPENNGSLLSVKSIANTYTNGRDAIRGLAHTTDVITRAADNTFTEHQFVTTTSYDAWGNALTQTVEAYSDSTRDPLKLLSVKAIVNKYVTSATPSDLEKVNAIRGLTITTDVTTYADIAKTIFAEHQFVETSTYDDWGNATLQTVTAKNASGTVLSVKTIETDDRD